jgi:hypothetical protein
MPSAVETAGDPNPVSEVAAGGSVRRDPHEGRADAIAVVAAPGIEQDDQEARAARGITKVVQERLPEEPAVRADRVDGQPGKRADGAAPGAPEQERQAPEGADPDRRSRVRTPRNVRFPEEAPAVDARG